MKHTAIAVLAAGLLAVGGLTAHADTLQLAGGETLDLGARVGVRSGERSFFGSQLADWLAQPDAEADMEKALTQANVAKDAGERKELAALAVDVLRHGKVYQVRSDANDTYYQGLLVSLSVSDGDLLKLALLGNPGPALPAAGDKAAQPGLSADSIPGLLQGAISITGHSNWDSQTSKNGVAYQTGSVQISLNSHGFVIPVYVKGIITKEEGRTGYTVLVADQVSGNYFDPIVNKALKGAKK